MVCHFVAPSARLASRRERGQLRMASSATVTIVGSAIIASTGLPASPLSPTGSPKVFWSMGTMTISPKNPYTTDGMPLSSSIMGFSTPLTFGDATSDMYMAMLMPKGSAKSIANRLTHSVPSSSGSIPNRGEGVAVGNHSLPPSTSAALILCSSRIFTPSPLLIMDSGRKAIIPGLDATREHISDCACSYLSPSCSAVKYSSASSSLNGIMAMSLPPSSFQFVASSSNTAFICSASSSVTGLEAFTAST